MTTANFSRINPSTIKALTAVKTKHCMPPRFAPAAAVAAHMNCPKCGSRLNYTVDTRGITSGRCVAADCVRWSLQ